MKIVNSQFLKKLLILVFRKLIFDLGAEEGKIKKLEGSHLEKVKF